MVYNAHNYFKKNKKKLSNIIIIHHKIAGYEHVYDIRPDKPGGECSLFTNENIPYTLRKDHTLAESVFIEEEKGTLKTTTLYWG